MISIIIPVYNTPIFLLERCLQSIMQQKYEEYEVIIVDDGSREKLSSYLDKMIIDSRFRIIHVQNSGVSAARNIGLQHAKGEYITFVDSDDKITPCFLEHASILIKQYSEAELILGGIFTVQNGYFVPCQIFNTKELVLKDMTILRKYYLTAQAEQNSEVLRGLRCGGPWCKLYQRKAIANLTFRQDIPVYEDLLFNLEATEYLKTAIISPEIWYEYYVYDSSTMRKFRPNGITEQYKVMKYLLEYQKKHPETKNAVAKKSGECIKKIITSTLYHPDSNIQHPYQQLSAVFHQSQTEQLLQYLQPEQYPWLPQKEKIFYTLCANHCVLALHLLYSVMRWKVSIEKRNFI